MLYIVLEGGCSPPSNPVKHGITRLLQCLATLVTLHTSSENVDRNQCREHVDERSAWLIWYIYCDPEIGYQCRDSRTDGKGEVDIWID